MLVNGLILAAGMSKRMGEFKPLLYINGKPMIEQSIDSMLDSGVKRVTLVLGYQGEKIEAVLKEAGYSGAQIHIVYNEDYRTTEMLDSVKIGVRSINDCEAFYLLPGDMPAISQNTFSNVRKAMEETKAKIVFPTLEGYRKHPPLLSVDCIPAILNFKSEGGLRELWKDFEHEIINIPVDDEGCNLDVDTKPQYQYVCQYHVLNNG